MCGGSRTSRDSRETDHDGPEYAGIICNRRYYHGGVIVMLVKCKIKCRIPDYIKPAGKVFLTIIIMLSVKINCYASDIDVVSDSSKSMQQIYDEYVDMGDIEDELSEIANDRGEQLNISFSDIFDLLINGDIESAIEKSFEGIAHNMTAEILEN